MNANTTWWLSFAGDEEGHLGAVFVDGPPGDFLAARTAMLFAGVLSPGGQCVGVEVKLADVPAEYREAWKQLPRLKLLSKDDLRVLGPLEDLTGAEQ